MRLISQNGMTDCPYESSSLYIKDLGTEHRLKSGEVLKESGHCVIQCNNNIASFKIAEYSTKEKALKVMEMLQQAYIGRNEALDLDMAEGTDEEMKDIMLRHGFGTLFVTRTNINPQADFRPLHTYFKFPADDEVEI